MSKFLFNNTLTFNIQFGQLEAYVHGLRGGILTTEDYQNLTQCESLEDLKLHLSGTSYGNFLQNEPSPITPNVIGEKATQKLVKEFNELRFNAVEPLAKFLDFIQYEYMINNVLKLITAVRNGRGALDILFKCHPLGMFPSIGVITAADNVDEMYELVLVDSPIGKFFTKTDVDKRDFDEFTTNYIRGLLRKNYLESFYDFVSNLGGSTAEIMKPILEFEADRATLTITRQSCNSKELHKDERKRLYPNFGMLAEAHDDLCEAEDDKQIKAILKEWNFQEYYEMWDLVDESHGKTSLEKELQKREVELNKLSFIKQFHFAEFYSIIKLREQETQNLMWISECVYQNIRDRMNEYIPIYGSKGFEA